MSLKKKSILIIIVVIILFFLFDYFQPHPSRKLVIAAGAKSGQYYRLANQLKNELSKNGIELEILVTKGSIDNLQLLNNKEKKVDIALVQSGTADSIDYPKIQSIAGLFYEPLWLVYRPQAFVNLRRPPDLIQDLKLKKVSLGVNGSGTLKLVKQIFDLEKIDVSQSNFFYLATDESLSRLQNGQIDAMFLSVNNHAQIMQTIFEDPSLKIMSFAKAYGYASKIKGLRVLNLPRATLDIVNDKPDREIFLLSSTAELVATKDIHPAMTSLLVDVLDDFLFKKRKFWSAKEKGWVNFEHRSISPQTSLSLSHSLIRFHSLASVRCAPMSALEEPFELLIGRRSRVGETARRPKAASAGAAPWAPSSSLGKMAPVTCSAAAPSRARGSAEGEAGCAGEPRAGSTGGTAPPGALPGPLPGTCAMSSCTCASVAALACCGVRLWRANSCAYCE